MSAEPKVEEKALTLLRDLAMHIDYDSGVNGSKFTQAPYGKVYPMWYGEAAQLPQSDGEPVQFVKELAAHAMNNGGRIQISNESGTLWHRLQAHFDSPPDILRDVIAPAIKRELGLA